MVIKEHSLEPATPIPLAIKAQEHQSDIFCEADARLMQDPDSFAWPPKGAACARACARHAGVLALVGICIGIRVGVTTYWID